MNGHPGTPTSFPGSLFFPSFFSLFLSKGKEEERPGNQVTGTLRPERELSYN